VDFLRRPGIGGGGRRIGLAQRLAQRLGSLRRLVGGQRVAHDGQPILLVCLVRNRRLDGSSSGGQLGRRRRYAVAPENRGGGSANHEKADQRKDSHRFSQKRSPFPPTSCPFTEKKWR